MPSKMPETATDKRISPDGSVNAGDGQLGRDRNGPAALRGYDSP
jgi:hypothetical protein